MEPYFTDQLGSIFTNGLDEDTETNKTIEHLCQIALAILFVFILANSFFINRAKAETEAAKNAAAAAQGIIDGIMDSDVGKEAKLRENVLIELQRQKLLNSLDKVERVERESLGLGCFVEPREIFIKTRVTNMVFIRGCDKAKESFSDINAMRKAWLDMVIKDSKLLINNSPADPSALNDPRVITDDNEKWLFIEIRKRVDACHADTRKMQSSVKGFLTEYISENPASINNEKLNRLLDLATDTSDPDRMEQYTEVYRNEQSLAIEKLLAKQGIVLLKGI